MNHYLVASDFDQTLSFDDTGTLLSEYLGASGFEEKVEGLAQQNLVQQGAELSYLLLHDPEYRRVRREDLIEVGRRIQLKKNVRVLVEFLRSAPGGYHFVFRVISAAPEEVVRAALGDIVSPEHIFGTRFQYNASSGEIESIIHSPSGYGKIAVLDKLQTELEVPSDRIVYMGDASSDVYVMLHVNRREGYTVAVSENPFITRIATRTVLADDAFCVTIPMMEDLMGWNTQQIRASLQSYGLSIKEWSKTRTDFLALYAQSGKGSGLENEN